MVSAIYDRFTKYTQWPVIQRVIERLENQGYQAVLAGGCVRDALLGRPIHDFDVATNARPDEVERVFRRTVDVGRAFGVMIVVESGISIEVATFRRDGPYRDGRHPDHIHFADLKEDASRRDFTINALYFETKSRTVIDEVGGVSDLQAQRIRAVGQPDERFKEDYLRILRAVRFAAQLNFSIEVGTWRAVCRLAGQVIQVASERQGEELRKIALAPYASYGWELMYRSRLLEFILPELNELARGDQSLWRRALFVLKSIIGLPLPLTLSWMALVLSDKPQDLRRWLNRLKTSSHEVEQAQKLTRIFPTLLATDVSLGKKLAELNGPDAVFYFALWQAYIEVKNIPRGELDRCYERYSHLMGRDGLLPGPMIKGEDLLSLGFEAGPLMGKILTETYWYQLESGLNREQLIKSIVDRSKKP